MEVSLTFEAVEEEKEFPSCACHLSKSSLQNSSVLPIIVTGSNAKLCFALTYCPHHVVYVRARVFVYMLSYVCVNVCACACQDACHKACARVCVCFRRCMHGRCLYALLYVLVEVAGGGVPTSHGPRGLDLPFQKMPVFLKFAHIHAHARTHTGTHTHTITHPHTASPACQRATWAVEACANRWEEPA